MANEKYCRNCGALNLPEAKFCANCSKAFVSGDAAASSTAASTAPSQSWQQPTYSPSPEPPTIFGISRKWVVIGIVALVLLLTLWCVAMASQSPSSSTATPTVKATVAATATVKASATVKATATPTPSGGSTQDFVKIFESNLKSDGYTVVSSASPTTFQGRAAYEGTYLKDGQTYQVTFIRMASNSEALSYQQQLINGYVAQGYTKDTANSSSDEWIGDLFSSSTTANVVGVQVLTTQNISIVAVYTAYVTV